MTMKASLKGKYDTDKSGAAANVAVFASDVKLRASLTDATVVGGPSLNGLVLAVEKPGVFIVDYNVPKRYTQLSTPSLFQSQNAAVFTNSPPQNSDSNYGLVLQDFRFQFMNSVRVADKPLNLTYIHSQGDNRTILDGTLVLNSANKVSANHVLGTGNGKFKYSYVHGGVTTFEPSYDLAKNSWDFAVSRRVYGDDVFRAIYQTSSKLLGLEWSRNSKVNGSFKVSASYNLAEERKVPKLTAESIWDFEM